MATSASTPGPPRVLLATKSRWQETRDGPAQPWTDVLVPVREGVGANEWHEEATPHAVAAPFEIETTDDWLGDVDLVQARNLVLTFNPITGHVSEAFSAGRVGWPRKTAPVHHTDFELAPSFNRLDEETAQFVAKSDLVDGVAWLREVTPRFFGGAAFEIGLVGADPGEDDLLSLKVYGAFPSRAFRERRHQMCEAMRAVGHERLYRVISIFQRRVAGGGWQALSWYSSLSPE